MNSLSKIIEELSGAGGFGDGIDTGDVHPIDILTSVQLSEEDRLAASLSLLCRLAEAVDNSTWHEATRSALARRTREFIGLGKNVSAECAPAVLDFYQNEDAFWKALQNVYRNVVSTRTEGERQ
jgi:hypothetical protein